MTEEHQPKKILVIRSATRVLSQALVSLREEFPGCRITVLASKSAKESMEQDPLVDEVLTITDQRRMSVASCGRENIKKLQERKFDLAATLYNIDHGLGYSNIDLLACAAKAKTVRGYNSRGAFTEVTLSTARKKAWLEKTTFFWAAVNYIATGALFFIITLALTCEWFVRLLFGKKQATLLKKTTPARSIQEPAKVRV